MDPHDGPDARMMPDPYSAHTDEMFADSQCSAGNAEAAAHPVLMHLQNVCQVLVLQELRIVVTCTCGHHKLLRHELRAKIGHGI